MQIAKAAVSGLLFTNCDFQIWATASRTGSGANSLRIGGPTGLKPRERKRPRQPRAGAGKGEEDCVGKCFPTA